ncbi:MULTISPECIES: hypothetical protein [Methanobacterium]|jgi:hypothetical protein|uniref:Uncharacterized protein n=1 Tax=Methanobacterium veterum TaxID=408577 RepID=A0A9E5DMW4_9EURY|nr:MULTISPECIES: hypothetical protein [Methanobacterium]MCZ3365508.1 hypothetical protein [Methanobacterium veterum]MCZ3373260.1 hypothetical protein [Methanobacterium veterum]
MALKNIFKIFLITIFVIGILNLAYADSGPTIGANQAKTIAQNYLNAHNLPYTAVTPGWDDWKTKVKDTKTGEVKWIPQSEAKGDSPDFGGPGRYEWVQGYNSSWVVQVNDKNGKNVGRIYIDSENGNVLKAILDPVSTTNNNQSTSTNATNAVNPTNQASQGQTNNTGLIIGVIILLIVAGVGYWMYNKRG